jgi:hypothetical protein
MKTKLMFNNDIRKNMLNSMLTQQTQIQQQPPGQTTPTSQPAQTTSGNPMLQKIVQRARVRRQGI